MSNFTLSQTPNFALGYMYPASDNTISLSVSPSGTHYSAVDEPQGYPNNDTDYVYTNSATPLVDMYNLSAKPSGQTGTINHIQICSVARAFSQAQSPTGEFKHKIICNAGTYLSPNYAPIDTVYSAQSTIRTTRPADGLPWTWADLDALKIGLSISSPIIAYNPQSVVLRPNAAGDITQCTYVPSAPNWDCVNEDPVSETDYVINNNVSTSKRDLYLLQTTALSGYTIHDVTVTGWIGIWNGINGYNLLVKTNGVEYGGVGNPGGNSPQTYSYTWLVNPQTGSAWTWTQVNALQAGVTLTKNSASGSPACYQLYVTVNYLVPGVSPDVRCTQIYAIINYVPAPITITLTAPNEARLSYSRKTERFIFPDGTYCIGDYGRAGKTILLKGTENSGAITKMRAVQSMLQTPNPVTIAGLLDVNQDIAWRLQDFNYEYDIGGDHFDWNAKLTAYDYVAGSP